MPESLFYNAPGLRSQPQVCNLIKKETLAQVFFCEFWKIFIRTTSLQNAFRRLLLSICGKADKASSFFLSFFFTLLSNAPQNAIKTLKFGQKYFNIDFGAIIEGRELFLWSREPFKRSVKDCRQSLLLT